jgi:CBS domain-containing protein
VRHVLVVDEEGGLQGVVSQRDLFHGGLLRALGYGTRAKQQALDSLLIKEAMKTEPITTTPDATLQSAARLMAEHKIECLPVLEGGRIVGIVTEGDFVLWAAVKSQAWRIPCRKPAEGVGPSALANRAMPLRPVCTART